MIVVCDMQEYEQLKGKSFVAETIRQFNIELEYISLNKERIVQLQNAMENQNLVKIYKNIGGESVKLFNKLFIDSLFCRKLKNHYLLQ